MSHLFETVEGGGWKIARWLRADVEQEVGSHAGSAYEIADECWCVFVVLIGDFVAPHAVHGLTRLKREAADGLAGESGSVLARKVALEYLYVFAGIGGLMMVVADET